MPRLIVLSLALLAIAPPLQATERRFLLAPGTVHIEFRAYGLGLLPISGTFARFSGTLTLDDPGACTLALHGDSASLQMPSASMTADAIGPDLLDVTRFPAFDLAAICQGPVLAATLTLHGVTRAVPMQITRTPTTWSASGTIDRREWGMGARPLLAGPEVRLTITAGLPPLASP